MCVLLGKGSGVWYIYVYRNRAYYCRFFKSPFLQEIFIFMLSPGLCVNVLCCVCVSPFVTDETDITIPDSDHY